jgi:hypothetical protein
MKKWLVLLLVCASAAADEPFEKGAVSDNRFLFIVSTSSGMRRCREAAEACVAELVSNGVQGRMRSGDTFGLWTFDKKLHTGGFPMQVWTPELNTTLARQARGFLARQTYESKTRFDSIAGPLASVARSSRSLLVFLLTDGAEPVKGTPFDRALNEAITKNYKALKALHLPFVIVMGVEEGQYVDIKLNSTVHIIIPEVARIEAKTAAPAPVAATNTTAALPERAQPSAPAAAAKQTPEEPSSPRPIAAPSPLAAPIRPAPAEEPKPRVVPPTESQIPASTQAPVEPAPPASAALRTNPPEQPPAAATSPGTHLLAASGRPVGSNEPADKQLATITLPAIPAPPSAENTAILLWAAFGFLFASISLLWILLRGSKGRPSPSLISRSVEKSKRES